MTDDTAGMLGAGFIGILIAVAVYAAVLAFSLWITWLIIRSAVRRALWDHTNGVGRPRR
jgi:hypothetical protein